MVKDWIVIGGGIHGCTIAAFLLKNNKVSHVIDPLEKPLSRWLRNTDLTRNISGACQAAERFVQII